MILGFTGTRDGLTSRQAVALASLLKVATEAHHGDCMGADAEFHDLAFEAEVPIIIHPPTDGKLRAFCQGAAEVLPPEPYLKRNRSIVKSSDWLVGCPKEAVEPKPARGQGTWSAIRFARKHPGCETIVIWPDGRRET